MAGKVGCALLLAVLFAAAAVSRTSFAVFFAALAVLLVGCLALVLSLSFAVRVLEHRLQAPFRA